MFADLENDDTNSIIPTEFDKLRILDMEIGQSLESELGNWNCLKYKDCFILSFHNHPNLRWKEFSTFKEMINFLEEH